MDGSIVNKDLLEKTWRVARKRIKSDTNNNNHLNIFYNNKYLLNSSSSTKNYNSHNLSKTISVDIVDSGASNYYGPLSLVDCIDKLPCHENRQVSLSNNTIITPTHTAYLYLSNISRVALKNYLFPDIPNKVLLYVS